MTLTSITSVFFACDGFLLQKRSSKLRVVNPTALGGSYSPGIRRWVELNKPTNIDDLFAQYSHTKLIPVDAPGLFEHCDVTEQTFFELSNGNITKRKPESGETATEVTHRTIKVYHNRVTKYLYQVAPVPVDESDDEELISATVPGAIYHSRDNSFYESVLRLGQIKFTSSDVMLINQLVQERYAYTAQVSDLYMRYQDRVSQDYTQTHTFSSYGSGPQRSMFPTYIQRGTLLDYSRHAAKLVMLAHHMDELSVFENIQHPTLDEELEDISLEHFSDYMCELLHNSDYEACWATLIKICAFDWEAVEFTGAQPRIRESQYRYVLDGIKGFTRMCCLYRCVEKNASLDYSPDDMFLKDTSAAWRWLRNVYHNVVELSNQQTITEVVPTGPDAVAVNGKPLSKLYLQMFYAQMTGRYDEFIGKLHKFYVNLKGAAATGAELLFYKNAVFNEDRTNPHGSILALWDQQVRRGYAPQRLQDTEDSSNTIIGYLSEMSTCVMWILYIALGGPSRYPEIAILKFAGNDRNIFVDPKTHCLDIIFTYSKSKSVPKIVKRLDKTSSSYLLHFILVGHQLIKQALGKDYSGAKRDLFGSATEEDKLLSSFWSRFDNSDQSDTAFSKAVIASFVFFDPKSHHILSRRKFSAYSQQYPNIGDVSEGSHLGISELRQGIIGLTRNFTAVEEIARIVCEVRETAAGHSVMTGLTNYGVNSGSLLGSETTVRTLCQIALCGAWQDWLNLDVLSYRAVDVQRQPKAIIDTHGGPRYIRAICRKMFGDEFAFRDGQEDLVMEIWSGDNFVVPVQALPGYGKTLLFQIPVVAMKDRPANRRVVSILFVPYLCLVADMADRLNTAHCNAAVFRSLCAPKEIAQEDKLTADIYVCSYEDMRDIATQTMIRDWDYLYRNTQLGYVVVDEAHNFGNQDYRSVVSKAFKDADWSAAYKVVLLSGTVGFNRYDSHLAALGLHLGSITEHDESGFRKDTVLVHNLVTDLPLTTEEIVIETTDGMDLCEMVRGHLANFLKTPRSGKAMVVCGYLPDVERMGRMTLPGSGILTLTGESTSEEKMSVMRDFKQNPHHRVIVGTIVLTEGIDIADVNLVILAHHVPSIPSFIQTVGRLRGSGKVVVLYRKNYKKRNEKVPQLDPAVDLQKQIKKFYFGEDVSVVERVANPVEEEAPGSESEEEVNPVEEEMGIPVQEETYGQDEEEAPGPADVEANPVTKSVSKEKSDVQDESTLIVESQPIDRADIAASERTLAKQASLNVSTADRNTSDNVLKRLPLMPLPRPAENSKTSVEQAEVICLSDDDEEVIEITDGSCKIIASNGGVSSRSSGRSSPSVIEIEDEELSTTFLEIPTIEDIPQFGESLEAVTPEDEDPDDIPFGWGSSEPLPVVSLKRRSSNTLASSEPKVSKVQKSSKLQMKIAAIIGTSKNVFALLGFDSAICSKLLYDTADDSAVPFNWKPVKYCCSRCFSVHKETCACSPSGGASIMSFARDVLLFLSEILPKEEMEQICKRSREEGPFTVLVGFNDKRERYKSLYMEKYKDNLEWIKKTTTSRCLDFPQNERWDCTYKILFNGMWDFLSSGKKDLLLFFGNGDIRSQDADSWSCDFQGEPFEQSYKRKLKASCKDLPFIIDYNNSDAFAIDTLIESNVERAAWYSEDFAMSKRTTPGPAGGNRIHPRTPVNDRMHLVMGFGIYFNTQFRAYLARTTSWFPSVGSFHHWMHVLNMNITSTGQWMPSYILIGAIYWKWLGGLHSKK